MNRYTTEFFSFCPTNNVRIKYSLLIETNQTIMVEDIINEVTLHDRGYHEAIADQLHRTFGGRQVVIADHHGVRIETVRGE
jgi:hypothetical protein